MVRRKKKVNYILIREISHQGEIIVLIYAAHGGVLRFTKQFLAQINR